MNPLPQYLPSNLSAEETLRALEPCFPPALMGHIKQFTLGAEEEKKWAQEEVEEAQKNAEADAAEIATLEAQIKNLNDGLDELSDLLDTVLNNLLPATRRQKPEVLALERRLEMLIKGKTGP
jgi:molecular chaperone GrpE (heat shock protein)